MCVDRGELREGPGEATDRRGQVIPLARISHTKKCIGAPNQRKLLCHNAFLKIQERPDDDRL